MQQAETWLREPVWFGLTICSSHKIRYRSGCLPDSLSLEVVMTSFCLNGTLGRFIGGIPQDQMSNGITFQYK